MANIKKSDEEWRAQLTPEQFHVTRQAGTERAFTGPNWDSKEKGSYLWWLNSIHYHGSERMNQLIRVVQRVHMKNDKQNSID